jgi:hypothetical protein
MGTRHLVCVKFNQEYKVSQFGSMGGQPQGAGVGCLTHLKDILSDLERFKKQLNFVHFIPADDEEVINTEATFVLPAHTVLKVVNEIEKDIKLYPSIEYAGESSCNWVYVVDLDDHSFKVYKGKNKDESKEAKEFTQYIPENNAGYRAVALLNRYDLDNLPNIDDFKKYHDDLERSEGDDAE